MSDRNKLITMNLYLIAHVLFALFLHHSLWEHPIVITHMVQHIILSASHIFLLVIHKVSSENKSKKYKNKKSHSINGTHIHIIIQNKNDKTTKDKYFDFFFTVKFKKKKKTPMKIKFLLKPHHTYFFQYHMWMPYYVFVWISKCVCMHDDFCFYF